MSIRGFKADGNIYRYDYRFLDGAPNVEPDKTLSISDRLADSKAVGDRFSAVLSPQKTSTISGMSDTEKVYIYTGSESGYRSGHWYYYDTTNSRWTDGGLYNVCTAPIDKTLTVSDAIADAKTVGDRFSALQGIIVDAFEDLSSALANQDTETATAILNQAVLDINVLG